MAKLVLLLLCVARPFALAGRMRLHEAADEGQVGPLKAATSAKYDAEEDEWKKPNVNKLNKKGRLALNLAVCNMRGEPEAVRVLLEAGADPNARDSDGLTALQHVAMMCSGIEGQQRPVAKQTLELLIQEGAEVNLHGTKGIAKGAPLHLAAEGGYASFVLALIKKGADVNLQDGTGHTPLHYAAISMRAKVSLLLIKAGADPNIQDADGKTPRDFASGKDSFSKAIRDHCDGSAEIRAAALAEKKSKRKAPAEAAAPKSEL